MKEISPISNKLITGNIAINLLGNVLPLAIAVFSIPITVTYLGTDRFGVLSIAWVFLGYFSILDLGLGRATTKFVIEYKSSGLDAEVRSLISTSIIVLMTLGTIVGVILVLFTPSIVRQMLNVPNELITETEQSLYIIGVAIPFIVGLSAVRGVLEANNRFRLINIIKIPTSALNYLIPSILAYLSYDLTLIILLLASNRVLAFAIHFFFCFDDHPKEINSRVFNREHLAKLISYGSWLTVSNIVGPIMVYFDRFIIGSLLTMSLLSYYSVPYEVVTKLLVIAGSAVTVLFPVFTQLHGQKSASLSDIYKRSLKGIILMIFPITFLIAVFANDILELWLNLDFADSSSRVLQLLSLGVLLNSLSAIPFTAIQSINRPDVTAKVHLVELPLYLVSLWVLALHHGINGVALAWAGRNLIDVVIFSIIYDRTVEKSIIKQFLGSIVAVFLSFLLAWMLIELQFIHKIMLFLSVMCTFAFFWWKALNFEERLMINRFLIAWKKLR